LGLTAPGLPNGRLNIHGVKKVPGHSAISPRAVFLVDSCLPCYKRQLYERNDKHESLEKELQNKINGSELNKFTKYVIGDRWTKRNIDFSSHLSG
jgi:hypothetical protein